MHDCLIQYALLTYKFTNKERDAESGLDNFGRRYYGSAFGRFTSADPKMITRKRMIDPQQWNMYSYVRNNPLGYVDPDGRELKPADVQLDAALTRAMKSETVRTALAPYMGKDHDLVIKRGTLRNDPMEPNRKELGLTSAERGGGIKTCSPDCGAPSPITLKNATITIDDSVKEGKGHDQLDGVLKHEISHANDDVKDPAGSLKEVQDNADKKHDDRPEEQRADQFSQDTQKEVDQYEKHESDEQKREDRRQEKPE
jgi:RHS repeat-associated protein